MFKSKKKTQEIIKKETPHVCCDGPYCSDDCPYQERQSILDKPIDPAGVLEPKKSEPIPLEITIETTHYSFTDSNDVTGGRMDATVTVTLDGKILLKDARPSFQDWAELLLKVHGSGKLITVKTTKVAVSKKV